MRRSDIPAPLGEAKRTAVQRLLAAHTGPPHHAGWVARSHPEHNVVGIGIGPKIRSGKAMRRHCIRIYVERKLPRRAVPDRHLLPDRIGGVATDVIETGRLRAFLPAVSGQKRLRPAQPGCSIGFQFADALFGEVMAGTLGAIVADRDGTRYLLSNNHVLANLNALPIGAPIFQPGLLDGGNVASDQIATLARFIPLATDTPNRVDCALAAVTAATAINPRILPKIGRLSSAEPIDAEIGMPVEKTGRATGYTTGKVSDVSANLAVQFDDRMLQFEDQLLVTGDSDAFSSGGDSGSLVVGSTSGRAVGLVIGGGPNVTIANHIGDVLGALDVLIVG